MPGHLSPSCCCNQLTTAAAGERNERIEQLEDDVRDMKRIFHSQLEVAVGQLDDARKRLAAAAGHADGGAIAAAAGTAVS